MATYHVKLNSDGTIFAGTQSKTGKWINSSDVTDECLAAARDLIIQKSHNENKNICYSWNYSNGKTLLLKLEEIDTPNIKET